jgi:hypothetical protein
MDMVNVLEHLTELEHKQVTGREGEVLRHVSGSHTIRLLGLGKREEHSYDTVLLGYQAFSAAQQAGKRCALYLAGTLDNGQPALAHIDPRTIKRLLDEGLVQ